MNLRDVRSVGPRGRRAPILAASIAVDILRDKSATQLSLLSGQIYGPIVPHLRLPIAATPGPVAPRHAPGIAWSGRSPGLREKWARKRPESSPPGRTLNWYIPRCVYITSSTRDVFNKNVLRWRLISWDELFLHVLINKLHSFSNKNDTTFS